MQTFLLIICLKQQFKVFKTTLTDRFQIYLILKAPGLH